MQTIKTKIVKIGNSRGIRIPKILMDQAGLGAEVEIGVEQGRLFIQSMRKPREGWDEQLEAMAGHGDDRLIDEAPATQWEKHEWQW